MNPEWSDSFLQLADRIHTSLGELALDIAHIGSTSVPGLPAKPVIDIDLIVPDSAAEACWLPQLEDAGFALTIRDPWWYEHYRKYFELMFMQHRDGNTDDESWNAWSQHMLMQFHQPGVQAWWSLRETTFHPAFRKFLNESRAPNMKSFAELMQS